MTSDPSTLRKHLDLYAFAALVCLTMLWGLNYSAIKISNQGLAPVWTSALRSGIAALCGLAYCKKKGISPFHWDIRLLHGMAIGLLFGLEFACLYLGTLWTEASRAVIFVYLSPFFVALGAHFLLKGEKLTLLKVMGLLLAFFGVVVLFWEHTAVEGSLLGDLLEVLAALFWAATTIYIKRFLAHQAHPIQTFCYQLTFSLPVLLSLSLVLEPQRVFSLTPLVLLALAFQSVVVAFISYYVWFKLIHIYPVSDLSAFTFLTPLFGVLFSGLLLKEEWGPNLLLALGLVCMGIFLVNYSPKRPRTCGG